MAVRAMAHVHSLHTIIQEDVRKIHRQTAEFVLGLYRMALSNCPIPTGNTIGATKKEMCPSDTPPFAFSLP